MENISPTSLELALWLIAREAARGKAAHAGKERGQAAANSLASADHVAAVCAKLRVTLIVFIGVAGYRSLLTRAIALAKVDEPSLAAVYVLADGSLTCTDAREGAADAKAPSPAGARALIAQLLDLLVVFVGRSLMLQLVRSAWSDMPDFAPNARIKDKQ